MVDVLQPSPVSRSNVLPSRARALRPPLGREVRTALDLVGDALVFVDRFELQIVDANVAARELFRVSTGDLYGRTLFDLLPDLDIQLLLMREDLIPPVPGDEDEI